MQHFINIMIEGKSPLICNRFTEEAAQSATAGTRSSVVGNKGTPLEIATSKLYIGSDNEPMIPSPNMHRSIIDGGKYFKNGKSLITTAKTSLIPACVWIQEVELPIYHKEPWTVDTRPVRIPSTGGRILCHRPSFHDWALNFTLTLDDSMITVSLLRDIIDAAGSRIGLGDFRPACKGPFGRYVVSKWEVQPQQ